MSRSPESTSPGAHWDGQGVHFSLFSELAEGVELCLFDHREAPQESRRVSLERLGEAHWQVYVPEAGPGQIYGYRVHGSWDPAAGLRFNPAKLLVDPTAAALCGPLVWHPALRGADSHLGDVAPSAEDSAPYVPRSVVVDSAYDWEDDHHPRIPWEETVIYECHVRGMTRAHPDVPTERRGTYLGLAHDSVIEHLLDLGVTTVELMPVQHFVSEEHLHRLNLTNYFGYNPLGFFAPHAGYASDDRGAQVTEFKTLVKHLHRAGLEVVLDVVFNHTAEGDHRGPSLSLRGIDNRAYYRLQSEDLRYYENFSGCGNTLHFGKPAAIELVLACLRYWVREMHVDGFRFDLAPVVGREKESFDTGAVFFRRLREDPVLAGVKLIAEPWDLGPDGYNLGGFPSGWSEWNDRYRDTARAFWRGEPGLTRSLSACLEGSSEVFSPQTRGSNSSINFVSSHDGFTLQDLVSFEHKHNWANGENNQDGHNHNLSCNWGAEGPDAALEIQDLRQQIKRNLLATLAISQGVPMLSHGDELGRSQAGNNNAYCHDSELTWVDWHLEPAQQQFLHFTRDVLALRRSLRPAMIGKGRWVSPHADELSSVDWQRQRNLPFGWLWGSPDAVVLVILNADRRGHLFELPEATGSGRWRQLVNTASPSQRWLRGRAVRVAAHALLVLERQPNAG